MSKFDVYVEFPLAWMFRFLGKVAVVEKLGINPGKMLPPWHYIIICYSPINYYGGRGLFARK